MNKRLYLCQLLWGNFKLYCHWLRIGNKDHANAIAYDAGSFVRMYRDKEL